MYPPEVDINDTSAMLRYLVMQDQGHKAALAKIGEALAIGAWIGEAKAGPGADPNQAGPGADPNKAGPGADDGIDAHVSV